jgi:hypothetical protein
MCWRLNHRSALLVSDSTVSLRKAMNRWQRKPNIVCDTVGRIECPERKPENLLLSCTELEGKKKIQPEAKYFS